MLTTQEIFNIGKQFILDRPGHTRYIGGGCDTCVRGYLSRIDESVGFDYYDFTNRPTEVSALVRGLQCIYENWSCQTYFFWDGKTKIEALELLAELFQLHYEERKQSEPIPVEIKEEEIA